MDEYQKKALELLQSLYPAYDPKTHPFFYQTLAEQAIAEENIQTPNELANYMSKGLLMFDLNTGKLKTSHTWDFLSFLFSKHLPMIQIFLIMVEESPEKYQNLFQQTLDGISIGESLSSTWKTTQFFPEDLISSLEIHEKAGSIDQFFILQDFSEL